MGNRGGALHNDDQRIVRTQKSRAWIICLTEFKGWKRELMQPGRYTELFFLDEVTALAAGHRPCFECRRKEAVLFAEALGRSCGTVPPKAPVMDKMLAGERKRSADDPERMIGSNAVSSLPDGAMIRQGATYHAVRGGMLLPWSFEGYGGPLTVGSLDNGGIYLATPLSTLGALSQGYRPVFHSRAWIPDT
ncbi:hypothetical protein WNZ14_09515 [Hoeflea sp. AS60]|uniref:hypothetical protein n=1 Tax=Hoeflea sp. AS60 TaxID=3135780 RepID=UPI003174AB7C